MREAFLEKAQQFTEIINPNVHGVLVAGSIAHSREECLKDTSDLDLVLVADDERFLESLESFATLLPRPFPFGTADGFTLHDFSDGIEVSVVMYTPHTFSNKLCALATTPMKIWRNNIGPGQYSNKTSAAGYTLRDFNGKEYQWHQEIVEHGEGYIVDYFPAQYIEDHFILGSYPQNLLNKPIIIKESPVISEGIEVLWEHLGLAYRRDRDAGHVTYTDPKEFLKIIYDAEKMLPETHMHLIEHFANSVGEW